MKKNKFIQFLCTVLFSLSIYASSHANTVVIDNVRSLNVNDNTKLKIDGRDVPKPLGAEQYGTGFLAKTLPGFKANVSYVSAANPNDGELSEINLMNSVIGPVTASSASSIQVLLVDLAIDADTVIEGAASIEDIAVGSIVAASGIESDTGAIHATRIEVLHNGSSYWLMTGGVANLNESGFNIGTQHLNFVRSQSNVVCDSGVFENGEKVIAEISPVNDYTTGSAVDALKVTCYDDFTFPSDPPTSVFINGLIESINASQTAIVVNGTSVTINENTEILSNTGATTLEVGLNVSINGYEDPDSSEIIASFIYINDEPVRPPLQPFVVFGVVANVTAVDFELDGEPISYNAETLFIEGTVADLIDGALIEAVVQGSEEPTGVFTAIQIHFVSEPPPGQNIVSVAGMISNLSADKLNFTINSEEIELSSTTLFIGTTLEELTEGQEVTVEGNRSSTSQAIMASLVSDGVARQVPYDYVSGSITLVNADQTQMTLDNGSVVNVTADTTYVEGTQANLIVGVYVDVSGVTNAANEIDADVVFFTQVAPPVNVFFSDFINEISADKTQMTVGSVVVNLLDDTQIVGGNIDSLVVGIKVQVEGVVDSQTGEVDASNIVLPVKFISAQAPIIASDVTLSDLDASNGKVMVMGIEVNQNELTMDPGALFVNGLGGYEAVAIYGYEDDAGKIWASFVAPLMIQTTPNGTTTFYIEGSVTNVASDQLEVMGVNIGNLSNAAFYNASMELITAAEFLNALSNGDSVAASDAAIYDRESNTLYAGALFLLESTPQLLQQKSSTVRDTSASSSISGLGIITEFIEAGLIFRAGFED